MPVKKCERGCGCGKHSVPRPWLRDAQLKAVAANTGAKRSEAVRRRMSDSARVRFSDAEQRKILSEAAKEKFLENPSLREHLSELASSQWKSEEFRQLYSSLRRGKGTGRSFPPSGGYVRLSNNFGHPLSYGDGSVPEHRKVLFDLIGKGPHSCRWCGVILEWGGIKGICVDHLDFDRTNNSSENLVVSCHSCNCKRQKRRECNG